MNPQTSPDRQILEKRNNMRWPLRARVVFEAYRLNARDLAQLQGQRRDGLHTKIVNVSLEGVEELRVLLHLAGISKPLSLTASQRQQIAEILQSHHYADWIDQPLTLKIVPPSSNSTKNNQIENNQIELSITTTHPARQLTKSMPSSTASLHHPTAAPPHEPSASPATTKKRMPRTHFSGVGQDFSVLDQSTSSKPSSIGETDRPPLFAIPPWLQQIGESRLLQQACTILDTNVLIALLLFLIVILAVQFETILGLLATLFAW